VADHDRAVAVVALGQGRRVISGGGHASQCDAGDGGDGKQAGNAMTMAHASHHPMRGRQAGDRQPSPP
jgi:hypothetical protein